MDYLYKKSWDEFEIKCSTVSPRGEKWARFVQYNKQHMKSGLKQQKTWRGVSMMTMIEVYKFQKRQILYTMVRGAGGIRLDNEMKIRVS